MVNGLVREIQRFAQSPGNLFDAADRALADEDAVRIVVIGQYDAVPIDDLAAFGDDRDLPRPLIDSFFLQIFAPDHLYVKEAPQNRQK